MKLILERKWTDDSTTHGVLSIEGTNFRCLTLELADRGKEDNKGSWIPYREALPPGTYQLRVEMMYMLMCFPTFYSIANFTPNFSDAKTITQLNCGDIAVGTTYEGDYEIRGNERAIHILARYAERYREANFNKKRNEREEFVLEVRRSEGFDRREGSWEAYQKAQYESENENLIEDDYD